MERTVAAYSEDGIGFWRPTLAGLCASLVGIGLARFAYTPLLPALVGAHWFAPAEAAYLGAANLAGYLAGALLARRMAAGASPRAVLQAMMVLATASFFACATPLSFLWFFLWRFASGLAGGALMALAAPTVLPCVPVERRGLAGGIVFTGVGLGIAASATLVPLLARGGLAAAWCGLGATSLALTAAAWRGWPEGKAVAVPAGASPATRPLRALYVGYALAAVGLVPHMVFFVDFVARGLGRGLEAGARYWVLFGVGAVLGPALAGRLADRIGFRAALRLALLAQGAAVALLLISDSDAALASSSAVVGAAVPGIVPLVLGRIHDLLRDGAARQAAWSRATAAFALGQAGAAYLFSFAFERGGGYGLLFGIGAGAVLLALLVEAAADDAAGPVFVGQRALSPRNGGADADDAVDDPGAAMTAPRILIVENDDDLRETLVDAAEERYEVDAVRSGAAMREALSRGEHDVVILNMALPADDALALADRAARRGCAVIAVPEEAGQFAEAAARGYYILVRPLTPGRIREAIERARRRVAAERA